MRKTRRADEAALIDVRDVIRCVECGKDARARGAEPRCKQCRKQHHALSAWAKTLEKAVRQEVAAKGPLKIDNKVAGRVGVDLATDALHGSIDVRNVDDHVMTKCPFCFGDGRRKAPTSDAMAACVECRGFGVVRVNKRLIPEVCWYKIAGQGSGWTLGTNAMEPAGTVGSGEVRFDISVRRPK